MTSIELNEVNHIIRLLKQKFISPYKIIYMIDQKQADHFKSRNQGMGCCASSQITIPSADQTKIQKSLAEMITPSYLQNILPELLQYCEDRYKNIAEKSKQDSLKITNDVQKYLVDNILAQSVNKFIFNRLVSKLAKQSSSLNTEIGLWATPATWKSKYPHINLELFQSKNLSQLFNKGLTVLQNKFDVFIVSAFQQLTLLQKIGKFEELLWSTKQKKNEQSNESKILRNPLQYTSLQSQNSKIINLSKICLLIQSIPFQLNMKSNGYLTITDAIQFYYYNEPPFQLKQKNNISKYQIIMPINVDLNFNLENNGKIVVKAGSVVIIDKSQQFQFKSKTQNKGSFIIKSFISEAKKIN